MALKAFSLLFSLMLFAGCAAVEEKSTSGAGNPPITTYSCFDYGKYDSLALCNNTTLAQCEASWQSFPNGGLQPCYSPVSGGEACISLSITSPPQWIYSEVTGSEATYCKRDTAGTSHHRLRSLVGCSSDTCLCQDQISLYNVLNVYNVSSTPPVPDNDQELCCPGYNATSSPACI